MSRVGKTKMSRRVIQKHSDLKPKYQNKGSKEGWRRMIPYRFDTM